MGSDQISDTIRNAVLLESLKSSEVEKFAPFLRQIDRSLREQLGGSELTEFKRARLDAMLKQVDEALGAILGEYTDQMQLDLMDVAAWQASAEAAVIGALVPSYTATIPALSTLKTAAFRSPLGVKGADGGKLLIPFIEDWSKSERSRVTGAIRQGWFEGKTNSEIIRTLRGTKDMKYADGLLAIAIRLTTQGIDGDFLQESFWAGLHSAQRRVDRYAANGAQAACECRLIPVGLERTP